MKNMKYKRNKDIRDDMPLVIKVSAYVFTTLLSVACLVPFLLCISASLTEEVTLATYGYRLIPKKFSTAAYQYILESGGQVWNGFRVTLIVCVSSVSLGLLMMSLFAYAVTRPSFPWKNQFAFFSYFTMLFSGGMVSSYIVKTRLYNLGDTIWVLILTGCVGAYNILLMRTYMRTSIPVEIFESAKIDGAGEVRCYWQFAIPMSKPMLATIGLFLTVSHWNSWNTAHLYLVKRNDLAPIQLVLKKIEHMQEYLNSAEVQMTQSIDEVLEAMPTESFKMALVTIVALPMLIAYPFFQRFFVKGITVGSVKG